MLTSFLDVQKCLTANNDRHIINLGIKKVNQSKVGLANKNVCTRLIDNING